MVFLIACFDVSLVAFDLSNGANGVAKLHSNIYIFEAETNDHINRDYCMVGECVRFLCTSLVKDCFCCGR